MIWLWNNTSWPMRKISRELNKAARLDCSKWPNQKVGKTECFLTQVMLWNCTSRCIIKSLTWGSHSFPASTSRARNKSKVRISTSEEWLWLWDWLPVVYCDHKRKWKESLKEFRKGLARGERVSEDDAKLWLMKRTLGECLFSEFSR